MPVYRKCTVCHNKVPDGTLCKCEVKKKRDSYRYYDKHIRLNDDNKQYTEFYLSAAWRHMSEYIMKRYHFCCIMCLLLEDKIILCDLVHHILELRTPEGWEKRLNKYGLIPLCSCCHNNLHSNYSKEKITILQRLLREYVETYG